MRVFLTGATGLIGVPLVERLRSRGHQPLVLTRNAARAARVLPEAELVEGNPQEPGAWCAAIDGSDAVINLAGESVFGKRWDARQKEVLRASRIRSTEEVVGAIARAAHRPAVLVNASAIGYYGNVPEGELTEKSGPGDDFLARLSADWEAAALQAREHGLRVAMVRVGVVLAPSGGALAQMLLPFKLGLGGPVGSGRQWVSWIHIDDIVGAFLTALDHPEAIGPINGTAPEPVRNKEFTRCLARALRRPAFLPIPKFALRVRFGQVAELVTGGQRVLPARLEQLGYRFQYPTCESAMAALFPRAR